MQKLERCLSVSLRTCGRRQPDGCTGRQEFDRFLEQVSFRQPTPAKIEALQLGRGVSLIRVLRTAYATGGRAVEVNGMPRADAYELVYEALGGE